MSAEIVADMEEACTEAQASGRPARQFCDFTLVTRASWTRERRVIGKAEWLPAPGDEKANSRFLVTLLKSA